MRKLFRFFGFSLRFMIGMCIYAVSKEFRAAIAYKLAQQARGANEPVTGGEEVTAVLSTPQGKQII
jgi:hypothetical protein